MAKARTGVDRLTIDVLLSALEAPKLELSAAALQSFTTDIRVRLLSSGVIKPEGYEAVAVSIDSHDDSPVALTWSREHGSFGYFSSIAGWVTIPHEDIRRYSIEIYAVFSALMSEFWSCRGSASIVVPDTLWDLGNLRFGGSSRQLPILFARRLHDPARLQAVRRGLLLRPFEGLRIVLTSTHPDGLRETFVQGAIVSIHDVLGEGVTVSPLAIGAHLAQVHMERRGEVLVLEGGGRVVHLYGEIFRFPKGVHQRMIVNLLYQRYLAGVRWVPSDEIVAELDLRDNARIRDYFKKHPAWNRLLTERKGMCGFCLEGLIGQEKKAVIVHSPVRSPLYPPVLPPPPLHIGSRNREPIGGPWMTIKHFNQIDLARRWRVSERTLERWRWLRQGPQYLKIGGRVVYRLDDIEAFEITRSRNANLNQARRQS